jgi:hypothetical protein
MWAPTSARNNSRLCVGSAHCRAIVPPALVNGRGKARRHLLHLAVERQMEARFGRCVSALVSRRSRHCLRAIACLLMAVFQGMRLCQQHH